MSADDSPTLNFLSTVSPLSLTEARSEEDVAGPRGVCYSIVLTGGPCAGKTTVQSVLTDLFQSRGWRVYCVPETATLLLGGGVVFSQLTPAQAMLFQKHLLKTMLEVEETFFALARSNTELGQNTIILCDRGAMDPSAYIPRSEWLDIISQLDLDEVKMRDCRYDCVVHLVTAARGAEPFYQRANNQVRSESVDLARELDDKTSGAWVGHPYLSVIDNSTGFEDKVERVVEAVAARFQLKGVAKAATTAKRKYLVQQMPPDDAFPAGYQDFDVVHHYILSNDPNVQLRVRRRGRNGIWAYTATMRSLAKTSEKVETRRALSEREYSLLVRQADPAHQPVEKRRRCFLHENQSYQIDVFLSPCAGLVLLEAHLAPNAKLPAFLGAVSDVTVDSGYSMHALSACLDT